MTEARPLRVFLCHASDDKAEVRKLSQRLQADGIDVWLDEEKLLPGQEWQNEIPQAVRDSDIILVCLSKQSTTKEGYVQKEIALALDIADEKPENTIFIIPLKLEICDLPGRLRRFQSADYFIDGTYQRLLQSFQIRANAVKAKIAPSKEKATKPGQEKPAPKKFKTPSILKSKEGEPVPTGQTPAGIPIYTFAGMSFVKVPAGKFIMGSSDDDRDVAMWEKPQHEVNIPFDYWIGRFPVTNQQFKNFIVKSRYNYRKKLIKKDKLMHPVVQVSWYDALKFVKWLNRNFRGNLPIRGGFTLPSTAEWEKAARGIDGRRYPWGNDFGEVNLGLELCNSQEANYGDTTPAGVYSSAGDSVYGVADTVGNVNEWTRSLSHAPFSTGDLQKLMLRKHAKEEIYTKIWDFERPPRNLLRRNILHETNLLIRDIGFEKAIEVYLNKYNKYSTHEFEKLFKKNIKNSISNLPAHPNKRYYQYPYENNKTIEDIDASGEIERILRGGAYHNSSKNVRCYKASHQKPNRRKNSWGFRVAIIPMTNNTNI